MHAEILSTFLCSLGQLLQEPASSDATSESVEVRYARAQVQLAEVNLKRVEQPHYGHSITKSRTLSLTVPKSIDDRSTGGLSLPK
jgi:hypothetical protein